MNYNKTLLKNRDTESWILSRHMCYKKNIKLCCLTRILCIFVGFRSKGEPHSQCYIHILEFNIFRIYHCYHQPFYCILCILLSLCRIFFTCYVGGYRVCHFLGLKTSRDLITSIQIGRVSICGINIMNQHNS